MDALGADIEITLGEKVAVTIPLVTITYHLVPGVYVELRSSLVLDAKAKSKFSGTIAGVVGFDVFNNEGLWEQ